MKIYKTFFDPSEQKIVGENLWCPFGGFNVFGGILISKSLSACFDYIKNNDEEVYKNKTAHSINCYFTRPCLPNLKLEFKVFKKKPGRVLSLYEVQGFQNDKMVCCSTVSVSIKQTCTKNYQTQDLKLLDCEYFNFDNMKINKDENYEVIKESFDISISNPFEDHSRQVKCVLKDKFESINDFHQAIGFLSDLFILETTLIPLKMDIIDKKIKLITSIDHKLYFHSSEVETELYFKVQTINLGNSKALCVGYFMNKTGKLYASCFQEGMLILNE